MIVRGLLALALCSPGALSAHDIRVLITTQETQVAFKVFFVDFDDGESIEAAEVKVFGPERRLLATGTTDAKGVWLMSRPDPGTYWVDIDGGEGHLIKNRAFEVPEGTSVAASPPETGYPWKGLAGGLATLAALAGSAWLFLRR